MAGSTALSSLLSQLLVAFTIEFDNEFENRMPHWTTQAGRASRPRGGTWLVSQVMWANVMQYVEAEGIAVAALQARSRTTSDGLKGLERWNYVTVAPRATARSSQGDRRPRRGDLIVRPTAPGQRAQTVWRPLAPELEARWRDRFGPGAIDDLRRSLAAVRDQFEAELPHYLPIVSPTQNGKAEVAQGGAPVPAEAAGTMERDLSVLLAQVLLQFALDYEREARVSLTIGANTLRVLNESGVPIRELPRLTGVSKEANSMALGFLARHACVVLEPDPSAGRGRRARLTPKGKKSQDKYLRLLTQTEVAWEERFGMDNLTNLRRSLLRVVGDPAPLQESVLSEGLTPYAGGWRASTPPPETLPHYPMVLHRGGYPDGS